MDDSNQGGLIVFAIIVALTITLVIGWRRFRSRFGAGLAVGYLLIATVPYILSRTAFDAMIWATGLTLPWSLFVPDLLIDQFGNRILPAIFFMCAQLNANVLYFFAVLLGSRKLDS